MKKIFILVLFSGIMFSSCTRGVRSFANNFTYKNPVNTGGYWTIIQGETKIEHCKCIYWSTEDDDACFMKDGKQIFVNGSSITLQED